MRRKRIGPGGIFSYASIVAPIGRADRRDGQEIGRVAEHLRGDARVRRRLFAVKTPRDRHGFVAFAHRARHLHGFARVHGPVSEGKRQQFGQD